MSGVFVQLPQGRQLAGVPKRIKFPGMTQDALDSQTLGTFRTTIVETVANECPALRGKVGNLFLKLGDGNERTLKRSEDKSFLSALGVQLGATFRVAQYKPVNKERQAELRTARRVKAVGNQVEAVGKQVEAVGGKVEAVGGKVEAVGNEILREIRERKVMETTPGETALMVKILNVLNVGDIGKLLSLWEIPFARTLKKAGKAQVLAREAVERGPVLADKLQKILENPQGADELKEAAAGEAVVADEPEAAAGEEEAPVCAECGMVGGCETCRPGITEEFLKEEAAAEEAEKAAAAKGGAAKAKAAKKKKEGKHKRQQTLNEMMEDVLNEDVSSPGASSSAAPSSAVATGGAPKSKRAKRAPSAAP